MSEEPLDPGQAPDDATEDQEPDAQAVTGPTGDAQEAQDGADPSENPYTFAKAAERTPEPTSEAGKRGYHGDPPSRQGDNPEDLTLRGQTQRG